MRLGQETIKFAERGLMKISDLLEFKDEQYFIKVKNRRYRIIEKKPIILLNKDDSVQRFLDSADNKLTLCLAFSDRVLILPGCFWDLFRQVAEQFIQIDQAIGICIRFALQSLEQIIGKKPVFITIIFFANLIG